MGGGGAAPWSTMALVTGVTDRILITSEGELQLEGEDARRWLEENRGRFRMVIGAPGLLVLEKLDEGRGPHRVPLLGEIMSRTTVLDLVSMIAQSNWRGELTLYSTDEQRSLFFDSGALKAAVSDVPSERLGEMLIGRGYLTFEQLGHCLEETGPSRRLGQVLIDEGLMDREQLFGHLREQAQAIFYGALLQHDGSYIFRAPPEHADPPPMTVHIPVQALIMEGVQRMDEMALFRERIPSGRLCPEAHDALEPTHLDETAAQVYARADGHHAILEIAQELGVDEFAVTKAVYQLLQQGHVTLRAPQQLDRATIEEVVERFNGIMRHVFRTVAEHGDVQEARSSVSMWIQSSGYADYFGETLHEDGSIDPQQVVTALEQVELDRPLEALHQAFHELAAFSLFAATPSLSRQAELDLAREVNGRLKSIRI